MFVTSMLIGSKSMSSLKLLRDFEVDRVVMMLAEKPQKTTMPKV